ncbi:hypothetical protein AOLI_G00098260 [Acnodon oligacanthus]
MGQSFFSGALGCALLALALGGSMDVGGTSVGFYPRFNPFFFLCTHHGELEGSGMAEGGGEVLLTLQIAGNPTAYVPGQEYQGLALITACLALSLTVELHSKLIRCIWTWASPWIVMMVSPCAKETEILCQLRCSPVAGAAGPCRLVLVEYEHKRKLMSEMVEFF